MIRRIDHVIAIVEDVERTRARLVGSGCPLVWDGRSGAHRDVMFSIGAVKLELLATAAFEGWPALADLAAHAGRHLGVRVAALDPGDLDQTIGELRGLGVAATEPRPGQLSPLEGDSEGPPIARWRNAYVDGLRGLLPGLPSFLCQIVAAPAIQQREGIAWTPGGVGSGSDVAGAELPIRFAELRVGVGDPARAAPRYERALGVTARPAEDARDELLVPLADTPIRLTPGAGLQLVLVASRSGLALAELAAELPGVRWALAPGGA